jgi:hypothetical protein
MKYPDFLHKTKKPRKSITTKISSMMMPRIPDSITAFKKSHKSLWNQLINHPYLEYSLTTNQETLSHNSVNSWNNFIVQSKFRDNLIRHTLKTQAIAVSLDINMHDIDYKKPNSKYWSSHNLNTWTITNSIASWDTEVWYQDFINSPERYRKIAIIVAIHSKNMTCTLNKYIVDKLVNYEYDLYDDEHNNLLLSKQSFVSDNTPVHLLNNVMKKYSMKDIHVMEKGDEEKICEAVINEIEFLDQFNL